jgi:hypothetical protein
MGAPTSPPVSSVRMIPEWLFPKLSEPACFDKEGAALIDCYRYVLVLLCDKEHVVDGLSGHHLALFTSS